MFQSMTTNDCIEERFEPVKNALIIAILTKHLTNLEFVCVLQVPSLKSSQYFFILCFH